ARRIGRTRARAAGRPPRGGAAGRRPAGRAPAAGAARRAGPAAGARGPGRAARPPAGVRRRRVQRLRAGGQGGHGGGRVTGGPATDRIARRVAWLLALATLLVVGLVRWMALVAGPPTAAAVVYA